jgi:hypothetical protein
MADKANKPDVPEYEPFAGALAPFEFEVEVPSGADRKTVPVRCRARQLTSFEWYGLDDVLIGELDNVTDRTLYELGARRLKLGHVLERIDNFKGGPIEGKEAIAAALLNPGTREFVWHAWVAYANLAAPSSTFRRLTADSGAAGASASGGARGESAGAS